MAQILTGGAADEYLSLDAEQARGIFSESIERLLDRCLDETAHLRAKICLDQIEPIVEQFRVGDIATGFVVSLFMA